MTAFSDNMRNGLKPEWQVLNTNGSVSNQITYTNRGVKMRNDQFDITGESTHFSLLLDVPIIHTPGQFWEVTFVPGELKWGYMQYFLHDSLTDAMTGATQGPFGVSQHWDNTAQKSYLYMQRNSANPTEDTKIEILEGDEPIILTLTALENGSIQAAATSDQWENKSHVFGQCDQSTFGGKTLYPCIHNQKSWNSSDGANLWRQFKARKI